MWKVYAFYKQGLSIFNTKYVGFETRRGELIFSIYLILPAAIRPGVSSASNRNEYQKQKNNVSGEYSATGKSDNFTAICELSV
jgi:hypothetical protein